MRLPTKHEIILFPSATPKKNFSQPHSRPLHPERKLECHRHECRQLPPLRLENAPSVVESWCHEHAETIVWERWLDRILEHVVDTADQDFETIPERLHGRRRLEELS